MEDDFDVTTITVVQDLFCGSGPLANWFSIDGKTEVLLNVGVNHLLDFRVEFAGSLK